MKLSKNDVIGALRLRVFALKFNLSSPMCPVKRRIASEELQEIQNRLFEQECLDYKVAAFEFNPLRNNQEATRASLSYNP